MTDGFLRYQPISRAIGLPTARPRKSLDESVAELTPIPNSKMAAARSAMVVGLFISSCRVAGKQPGHAGRKELQRARAFCCRADAFPFPRANRFEADAGMPSSSSAA